MQPTPSGALGSSRIQPRAWLWLNACQVAEPLHHPCSVAPKLAALRPATLGDFFPPALANRPGLYLEA